MIRTMSDVYDMITQNDRYKSKVREKHEKDGLLRSAEGTAAEIRKRIQDE